MPLFYLARASPLFRSLGIPYGFFFKEGYLPDIVFSLDYGYDFLAMAEKQWGLTKNQIRKAKKALRAAGLLQSLSLVFERIMAYEIPEDFVRTLEFHNGYICFKRGGGRINSIQIHDKIEGIDLCHQNVQEGKMRIPDAVLVCRQIITSDLPGF